jgi:hypothetical protein
VHCLAVASPPGRGERLSARQFYFRAQMNPDKLLSGLVMQYFAMIEEECHD